VKVCWAGTFDPGFGRNKRLAEYMESAGIETRLVRVDLWPIDRVSAFREQRLAILLRMTWAYPLLLLRLLLAPTPDVYLVSYPGWFDVFVVRLVALLKRRPLVFDIFISLYDTAVSDRRLENPGSLTARLARFVDRRSMRLSDRVIADCPTHARFLSDLSGVEPRRFGVVYLGADESVFHSSEDVVEDPRLVLFYGTFVPLQGVEWIIEAAARLENQNIRFRLIGEGQTRQEAEDRCQRLGLRNVEFGGLMPQEDLVQEMSRAALCLGVFGTSDKANRVIPHKLFEALAVGRPILTGATQAVMEVFEEGELAVCKPGDSSSIAESIAQLLSSPTSLQRIASAGNSKFEVDFSRQTQGIRLLTELQSAFND